MSLGVCVASSQIAQGRLHCGLRLASVAVERKPILRSRPSEILRVYVVSGTRCRPNLVSLVVRCQRFDMVRQIQAP